MVGAAGLTQPPPQAAPPPATDDKPKTETASAPVKEAHELVQSGLSAAVQALGVSLRVMIANGFLESDGGRRTAENAFEAAKNVPAGQATREHLATAIAGLTTAVNHVANHSLKFPGDLNTLRNELRKVSGFADQYDALAAKLAKA